MTKATLVRFMPRTVEWSPFTGWEGEATDNGNGMWSVSWRHALDGMPTTVDQAHLSFRIRSFSRRFR